MSINNIAPISIMDPVSVKTETPEPAPFLNNLPFETPCAVDVAHLRDRKITCANKILRQTTELEQMEFPRKLKLIGLWTGIILTALVAAAVVVGGLLIGTPLLAGLIGGGVVVGVMVGIGSVVVGAGILGTIVLLLKKLFVKGYVAIQKPKEDLSETLRQNISEWHENRSAADSQTTLNEIREILPCLERLKDPVLCNALERNHTEYHISRQFPDYYKDFLSNKEDDSSILSAIERDHTFSNDAFYVYHKNIDFLGLLPANIQRYDQLQLRGAAMRAVIEPRDRSFGGILGIAEGYMGLIGSRPESAPLPAAS